MQSTNRLNPSVELARARQPTRKLANNMRMVQNPHLEESLQNSVQNNFRRGARKSSTTGMETRNTTCV